MTKTKPTEVIRAGNHLWAVCPDCKKLVKLTGFFRGLHICVDRPKRRKETT